MATAPMTFPGMTPPPAAMGAPSTEPISGDSLTQFIRSLQNYLATQGASTFGFGQELTGQGAQGVGAANNTLQPSTDYWTKLLSGDPATMTAAVAPTANAINTQYDTATRQAVSQSPRGGYMSGQLAALPWQKAATIGNLYQTLQPTAATNLASNAGIQGGLAQILGQLGLGTMGQGSTLTQAGANLALGRRGQNVQESGQNKSLAGQLGGAAMGAASSIYGTNAQFSDERLKEDIVPTDKGLRDILSIPVHDYKFKGDFSGTKHTGFMAQELSKVTPHLVRPDDKTPWLKVDYAGMVPVLTRAIQEQQDQIARLERWARR